MKKTCKIIVYLAIFIIMTSSIYATTLKDALSSANGFLSGGGENGVAQAITDVLNDADLKTVISSIGNLIILLVTAFLGVKYIFSSINGKAAIKESLPNLIVGILFFYLAGSIWTFSEDIGKGLFGSTSSGDIASMTGSIYKAAMMIINACALFATVIIGIKYMITSSDGKADVKKQLIPYIIGLVLIYAAGNIVSIVISIGKATI